MKKGITIKKNKRLVFFSLPIFFLSSCATYGDLQKQNEELQTKVYELQNSLNRLEKDYSKKPLVTLPTGSPTTVLNRNSSEIKTQEDFAYESAYSFYKSGNAKIGIQAFEKFNRNYPKSKYKRKALYHIAQLSYSQRSYKKAEDALKELIFKDSTYSDKEVELLKKIYKANKNLKGEERLNSYLSNKIQEDNDTVIDNTNNIYDNNAYDSDSNKDDENKGFFLLSK